MRVSALAGFVLAGAACSPSSGPVPVVVLQDGGVAEDTGGVTRGDALTGTNSGACGITFYGNHYPPVCQTILDRACCSEETACAGVSTCRGVIDCEDACPLPRQDGCLKGCMAMAPAGSPGAKVLSALLTCRTSLGTPDGGSASECAWPD